MVDVKTKGYSLKLYPFKKVEYIIIINNYNMRITNIKGIPLVIISFNNIYYGNSKSV